jgi:hypothetical protein
VRAGSTGASSWPRSSRKPHTIGRDARPILVRVHQWIAIGPLRTRRRTFGPNCSASSAGC